MSTRSLHKPASRSTTLLGMVALLAAAGAVGARDGDLDHDFGVAGKAFPAYLFKNADPLNTALALQSDGKMLIASSRQYADVDYDFTVVRLNSNGSIDTSFGVAGEVDFAFDRAGSNLGDHVTAMVLQPDGKILLAGNVDGDPSTGLDMGFVRLLSTGAVDTSYGTAGSLTVPFNLGDCSGQSCDDRALSITLQADGKALVAGSASDNAGAKPTLTRLTKTGQRDTTFDLDGRLIAPFSTGDLGAALRAKQLADGEHIVVVGGASLVPGVSNINFVLARLNSNGSIDQTFGVGGQTSYGFDVGGNDADVATDFVELADGKLVLCGVATVNAPNNTDMACMRFLANGIPDPGFTPVLIPFDVGGDLSDESLAVAQDAMGRFVVIGAATVGLDNRDFAVARLTSTGELDTTFGVDGTQRYDSLPLSSPNDLDNVARSVAIQPDGKIVIAGTATMNAAGDVRLEVVRLVGDTIFADRFE